MRFLRDNSLSLFFGALLLLTLLAQSLVGHSVYNEDALTHGRQTISYLRYLASSQFGEAVMENWDGHSFTGWSGFNDEQRAHGEAAVSWTGYLGKPDFREQSFQNWQSELLAIGAMVVFSIYLRQRGSPESKAAGAPHEETGSPG